MTQNATLDDGASAPGLSPLARLKLTRELATVKTDIAAIAAGPRAALARLKLVARANAIRAQLGGGVVPVPQPAEAPGKGFEIGTIRFEPVKIPDPRRDGEFYWAAKVVETGEVLEDIQKESVPKLEARFREDFERGLKGDVERWRRGFGLQPIDGPAPAQAAEPAELVELREVAAGQHDGLGLDALLSKIDKAARALSDAGLLSGEAEAVAHEAITHWARLELQANG